jgi:hypothetical protein
LFPRYKVLSPKIEPNKSVEYSLLATGLQGRHQQSIPHLDHSSEGRKVVGRVLDDSEAGMVFPIHSNFSVGRSNLSLPQWDLWWLTILETPYVEKARDLVQEKQEEQAREEKDAMAEKERKENLTEEQKKEEAKAKREERAAKQQAEKERKANMTEEERKGEVSTGSSSRCQGAMLEEDQIALVSCFSVKGLSSLKLPVPWAFSRLAPFFQTVASTTSPFPQWAFAQVSWQARTLAWAIDP